MDDDYKLHQLMYLAEKTSEHPIAQAICKNVQIKDPSKIDSLDKSFTVINFKNRNGEGVITTIKCNSTHQTMTVLCGNKKLMES